MQRMADPHDGRDISLVSILHNVYNRGCPSETSQARSSLELRVRKDPGCPLDPHNPACCDAFKHDSSYAPTNPK